MARHVFDLAAMLSVMVGVDPADEATSASEGRYEADYTRVLDEGGAAGGPHRRRARLPGIRFRGRLDRRRRGGRHARGPGRPSSTSAIPAGSWTPRRSFYTTIRWREFKVQIGGLPGGPRAGVSAHPGRDGRAHHRHPRAPPDAASRTRPAGGLFEQELNSGSLDDYEYTAMRNHGLPLVRAILTGVLDAHDLDAIVYRHRRPDPAPPASTGVRHRPIQRPPRPTWRT